MRSEPVYFGPAGHESFGRLHPAAGEASTGLLICSSFGREELCVHRTLRHIAEGAAARGMPALRFDYPCTGDSAGDEYESGQVARWIESIGLAIELLRARTGVQRVHVLGFRAGALLASQALRGRGDVAGLLLFAPPASGRLYVRELKMAGLKLNPGDAPEPAGLLESGGYAMPADSQAALAALSFDPSALPENCPVLLIERDDRPTADAGWMAALQASRRECTKFTMEGYADMLAPSFRGVVPEATLLQLFSWLNAHAAADAAEQPARAAMRSELLLDAGDGRWIRERIVVVDAAIGLQGVLTEPLALPAGAATRPMVLLLPPGADRSVGPGRLYVGLARQLARTGQVVLRLDVSGVGDSPARPACAENAVYQPYALDDVAAAVRYLQTFPQAGELQMVGHCSGAYNALRSALRDPSMRSITLVNPLTFFWKPGMLLEDPLGSTNLAAAAMNYRQNIFSPRHWFGVLRDPRKVLHVLNVLLRWPLTRIRNAWRDLLRDCGARISDDLGRELLELARAGVDVHFFFSTGDPGETLLRLQAGRAVGRLQRAGKLSIERIPGADHDLSFSRDRNLLLQHLLVLLRREPLPPPDLAASRTGLPLHLRSS